MLTKMTPKCGIETSTIAARMARATQISAGLSSVMRLWMREVACDVGRHGQHARIVHAKAVAALVQHAKLHRAIHDRLREVPGELKTIPGAVGLPDEHRQGPIGWRWRDRRHRDLDFAVFAP